MKRAVVIFMASILALGVLTGCGSSTMKSTVSDISSSNSSVPEQNDGATVKVTSVGGITFESPKNWEVSHEGDMFYVVNLPVGIITVTKLLGDLFDEATVNKIAREIGYTVESTELTVINGIDGRKTVYTLSNGNKMEEYMVCKNGLQIFARYTYPKEEGATVEKEFTDLANSIQFVDSASEQSKEEGSRAEITCKTMGFIYEQAEYAAKQVGY